MSEFDDYQRRRGIRANAHLYIRHDSYRFMPPGSPLYAGRDVVKYFELKPQQPSSQHGAGRLHRRGVGFDQEFDTELRQLRSDFASLRLEWARIKFASKVRKYDPNQPRVPAGSAQGGQWTSDEGAATNHETVDDALGQEPGEDEPRSGNRDVVHDRSGQEPWDTVVSDYRGDGSLARQMILNRDGSAIRSEFSADPHAAGWDERHSVRLADGNVTTFQNSGETQTVFNDEGQPISAAVWTPNGPESQAIVQPALLPLAVPLAGAAAPGAIAAQRGLVAGLTLFTWLSSSKQP